MRAGERMNWGEKTVLITGGTGSFGRQLTSLLMTDYQPRKIIIFSRDEMKQFTMRAEGFDAANIRYFIGDVRDKDRLYRAFYDVDIVVHAAAMKQVPLMQKNAREAVRNNIFGLLAILEAAERNGCESFIFISSDKSVRPSSVMGATKRVGELILSMRPSRMRCLAVRFGNVLGSNGSIVPILQEQIRTSGELTITHPDARRFFMTIHEAVSLVLQASSIGEHGEILVLDMGRALRIVDLAKTLVRLSGKYEQEVRIRFSGLRPGEKLCEQLFHAHESVVPTAHPKIRIARAPVDDWSALESQLGELRLAMEIGNDRDISSALFSIVAAHAPQIPAASVFIAAEETEPALLRRAARA